ncbi:potassium/sodium hyperpolarization-activated cyclic nucleotide-gated channel 1-like [Chiloscyllium plagiosum]|uniref:potassium/sodium hyperpolarization-activated cyclic nucleotide-gated channel 1-like n=1 Tax=Chiloscyllium plagiosum TaxID=36176 RepID=UPI001CB8709B|nr:potassium/sodium hyperpolarization-activated cyclic nucleotide-gated channel 1-like [Chiloscyllium plagiosum]
MEGESAGIDEGGEQVENDDAGKDENDQEMEDVGKNEGEDQLDLEGERSQGEEQVTGNDSETEAKVKIIHSSLVVDEEMIKIEKIDTPLDRSESICVDVLNDEKQIKTAVLTRIRRRLLRSFRKLKERLQQPQINRLTLYIFGSEDAVLKECERAKNVDTFVIHPYSTLRSYYVMYVLALTFANLIITPLGITFFDKDQGLKTIAWRMFSFVSDILYLVDIIINFRVGFFSEDREVVNLNPKEIAMRYVKTWLVIDLAAAFPLDSILFLIKISGIYTFTSYTFSKFLRFLYFGRIVSLVQLLQVSSLMRRFKEWELATDVNLEPIQLILRTFSVCFLILIICHWNGCIQFFIPMIQGFPEDSWVAKANLTKAWWADQYSAGVFRAISHTLGNSYGTGGLPTELTEVAVTVVSMISGALMHTIMVANVADMVLNADVPGRMYREKLCQVEEYTRNKRLPRHLRMKISNYYRERFHGKWFNQEAIISEMTEYLKEKP